MSALDVQALLEPVTRLVTAVQSAPLTQKQLWERWGRPDERAFQRRCQDLKLVPFMGRGAKAMYRMAAVLRAEELGEKRNGGGAA